MTLSRNTSASAAKAAPSRPAEEKSFFDWIKSSMAADGLLVPAPWQDEHAALASAEFTDKRLQQAAVILAVLHPHVLDTIAQAPVLVLAAAGEHGGDLRYRSERLKLATRFIAAAGASPRLPHIMRAYGLTPPMRRLAGAPLAATHIRPLKILAGIPEESLARIIPSTCTEQRAWLIWLSRLAARRWPSPLQRDRFVGWAAVNLRTHGQIQDADDLADWAMLDTGSFDPDMSPEQAQAASDRWHEEQASVRPGPWSLQELSVVVDYGPLPATAVVDGLELHALRTITELDLESQRMHHCVRSYWPYVSSGRSRIYSIRSGENRIATLELQPDSRKRSTPRPLVMAQIKGPCNARPAEPVIACARRFLEIANAAIAEAAKLARAEAALAKAAGAER